MKNIFIIAGLMLASVLALQPQSGFARTYSPYSKSQLDASAHQRAAAMDLVSSLLVVVHSSDYKECSGILIAPNIVLTAKHCLHPVNIQQ